MMPSPDSQSPLEHREWASKHGEVRIHISDAQGPDAALEFPATSRPDLQGSQRDAEVFASRSSANAATQTELMSIHVVAGAPIVLADTRTVTAEPLTKTSAVESLSHPVTVSRGSSSSSSFRAIAKEMEAKSYAVVGKEGGNALQQKLTGQLQVIATSPDQAMQGNGSDGEDDSDEKVCRVCQLSLYQGNDAMELGCACKAELALAHRHCAEAWFNIRGNRTCEVCGKAVENLPELNSMSVTGFRAAARDVSRSAIASVTVTSDLRWWQQQPVRNFLLACAVIAFMLPWLFRFFSS